MPTHGGGSAEFRRSSDALVTLRTHPKSALSTELQRVSHLFQGTSSISEPEFVINCKSVMNLLHYSRAEAVEAHNLTLLVEVIENAIFTFVLRILPLVFRELIAPTTLLHPISPPMILSLLEAVDEHVNQYGDYMLQLRMAAARLLLQDNEDVALALSMCRMLPRIQPNTRWQLMMNPIKANPVSNLHGSISLPEIRAPVLPESPVMSQDGTSLFGSPIPSLSSLLNCNTPSSASLPRIYHQYDPNHANIITESVSQPILPVTTGHSLVHSLSAPNLQIVPTPAPPNESASAIITSIVASEGIFFKSDSLAREILFPSSDRSADDQQTIAQDDKNVLPDIHVEVALAEDLILPSSDGIPFPPMSPFTSQDDLTKLIACPDVGEEPPLPPLFNPNPDADFSLSIGPPPEVDLSASRPSSEYIPLSPLSNQVSSPLSSPPKIIVEEDNDVFRNTFEIEVQKRPPSPYNKRLRSASNNPQPTMRRAEPSKRAVSTSARKAQLDPDLAALTLPPPPNPKAVVPTIAPRRTTRAKRPQTPSLTRRNNPIVIDDDDEPAHPRQRTRSASVNKENE
ncbi:hypothetical protein E4T56_gene10281 [Termitomyces sp. T112]|nr:hypothetical protein C0989_008241 [Termitomyces sp. Mn162]KAG5725112.1 hypothetical protein E4T56_gene10281 [Termitomyces sp. T112]KAH0579809.1 hypothetical protein H2248_002641 [Termitomyces sp. 'cryptogamus']KNZ71882.1 hypothetical protein J132_05707 [Termitomyces sp. J132]